MKEINILYLFLFSTILFWTSCANEGLPIGGAKDVSPPELIASSPPSGSTMFSGDEITLLFNEYFNIISPIERIVISPPLQNLITYKIKGKKLILKLNEDSLKANTTYLINFTDAIKDITEGNKISNFQYVFSTGKVIDSLNMAGKVTYANDNKPVEGALVMLYKSHNDTVFRTKKPYYFTKTNKDGGYNLSYLSAGNYSIYALKDDNFSYTFDIPSEEIAFHNAPINITPDTAWFIPLKLFTHKEKQLRLIDYQDKQPGQISFVYNQPIKSFYIKYLIDSLYSDTIYTYNPYRDSVSFWYSFSKSKQHRIVAMANDSLFDTISVSNQPILEDKIGPFTLEIKPSVFVNLPNIHSSKPLTITTNRRIKSINNQRVILSADSFKNKLNYNIITNQNPLKPLIISYNWGFGNNYSLKIMPGAFEDYYGNINDTLIAYFKTPFKDDLGSLSVDFPGLDKNSSYIIQLLTDKLNLVKESLLIDGAHAIDYQLLVPGKYYLKIIADRNNNGVWDTGDLSERIQPEKIKFSEEPITIRANWDLEMELFLNR